MGLRRRHQSCHLLINRSQNDTEPSIGVWKSSVPFFREKMWCLQIFSSWPVIQVRNEILPFIVVPSFRGSNCGKNRPLQSLWCQWKPHIKRFHLILSKWNYSYKEIESIDLKIKSRWRTLIFSFALSNINLFMSLLPITCTAILSFSLNHYSSSLYLF